VPLRRYVDFAIMYGRRILYYPTHAVFMGGECVAEFPEGVALEVETWLCLEVVTRG